MQWLTITSINLACIHLKPASWFHCLLYIYLNTAHLIPKVKVFWGHPYRTILKHWLDWRKIVHVLPQCYLYNLVEITIADFVLMRKKLYSHSTSITSGFVVIRNNFGPLLPSKSRAIVHHFAKYTTTNYHPYFVQHGGHATILTGISVIWGCILFSFCFLLPDSWTIQKCDCSS